MRLARTQSPPAVYPPGFLFNEVRLRRTLVLVDGLNLWHALNSLNANLVKLDLVSLCNKFGKQGDSNQIEIVYFTALLEHLDSKNRNNQYEYLAKLKSSGVKVVLGEFRATTETCTACQTKTWVHHEKRTDVALAVEMIRRANNEKVNQILIFSADTDFIPAIEAIKKDFESIEIRAVSTVKYLRPIHSALSQAGAGQIRLSEELVSKHQFS